MARQPAPPISGVLIEWLQAVFPDRCPDPDMTDREVWMAVGAQKVMKRLRAEHQEQTKRTENIKHVHRA